MIKAPTPVPSPLWPTAQSSSLPCPDPGSDPGPSMTSGSAHSPVAALISAQDQAHSHPPRANPSLTYHVFSSKCFITAGRYIKNHLSRGKNDYLISSQYTPQNLPIVLNRDSNPRQKYKKLEILAKNSSISR